MSLSLAALALLVIAQPLVTTAEQTDFKHTGRYPEAVAHCRRFEKQFPGRARCATFGVSPEGRPMVSLVLSSDGTLTPELAARRRRPVVFLQAGIHAGEIDGKDAGFIALRDAIEGVTLRGVLSRVTVVFVPVLNVDGHERFAKNQRPNQVGPEETGFRVTAQSLNLNRDFVKADATEMEALLGTLTEWRPILHVDLHVTNGAQFEHDVAVLFEPTRDGNEALRPLATAAREALISKLTEQGHLPLKFYPSFKVDDDPTSGFVDTPAPPRFALSYWAQRNRIAVLVETHSWRDYAHRVKTTRRIIDTLLQLSAQDGSKWLKAARTADASDLRPQTVTLEYEAAGEPEVIDFRGYAYTREPSQITSRTAVRYDPTKPELWKTPLWTAARPVVTVTAPRAGYVVPAAHAGWMRRKLRLHGFDAAVLRKPASLDVEVFRATKFEPQATSFEGRQPTTLEGEWKKERRTLPAGSLFVPSTQPGQRLLLHLFEPLGPDSLAAWGYFNAHFEQREYVEDYVLESFARELLARDPAVKQQFEARLKDPAFAADDAARMRFFAVRHPAWEETYRMYPIHRVDAVPEQLR